MQKLVFLSLLILAPATFAAEQVPEVVSNAADRDAVAITVYNDDLALVKERRKLRLPAGLARLSLREVSAQMRPETVLLQGGPMTTLEQNFDFDLLTPAKMLEKYVGRDVTVIRSHPTTGEEKREQASVLSAREGIVLRFADRIETGTPGGRIAFESVPPNLRDRPTLSILLDSPGGARNLELSYLTGGLSWQANYVANLSADGKMMDLSGWVTLTNRSGTGYDDAKLQLVAGKVNRVRPAEVAFNRLAKAAGAPAPRSAEATQEALMDYHLYSFERPTSIADNQTKQLALLSAQAVPVRREYLLMGADWYYRGRNDEIGQKLKPAVYVQFDNKGGQMGKPLPSGVVRVYAKDSKGAAQFVGEDRIEHTAKNETIKVKLGEAFDITAARKQLTYQKLGDASAETSYRIDLRNAKEEAVIVRVQEPLPGDWQISQETQRHTKESSRIASWDVDVPAGGAATLEYTVRVKW